MHALFGIGWTQPWGIQGSCDKDVCAIFYPLLELISLKSKCKGFKCRRHLCKYKKSHDPPQVTACIHYYITWHNICSINWAPQWRWGSVITSQSADCGVESWHCHDATGRPLSITITEFSKAMVCGALSMVCGTLHIKTPCHLLKRLG